MPQRKFIKRNYGKKKDVQDTTPPPKQKADSWVIENEKYFLYNSDDWQKAVPALE